MARRKSRRAAVERTPTGYVLNIDREEIDLVVRLLDEVRMIMLSDDPQHEALVRRLFPPAYHLADDAKAEAEYQRFMREELVASRLEAINEVDAALRTGRELTEEQANRFMQALNSVRLVLGTLLDVSEEHDPSRVSDDDPMVGEHQLYSYLSWLLEATVHAVSQSRT